MAWLLLVKVMNQNQLQFAKHPILVVDDDEDMRKFLMRFFHKNPRMEMFAADSPVKAKEILEVNDIHMIITDQHMPELLGTELLSYVREKHPNTLRFLLTGQSVSNAFTHSIEEGSIHACLSKPLDPAIFMPTIDKYLNIYESQHLEAHNNGNIALDDNTNIKKEIQISTVGRTFLDDHQESAGEENIRKISSLEKQFEDYVFTSIKMIESRDSGTAGHSKRVAELSIRIGEAIGLEPDYIKTLEFSAYLHDFGKIFINPDILEKAGKLTCHDRERLNLTFDYLYRYQELCYYRHEIRLLKMKNTEVHDSAFIIKELHQERDEILESIKNAKLAVDQLNSPESDFENPELEIEKIAEKLQSLRCLDIYEKPFFPLKNSDMINLSTCNAILNTQETEEFKSYVIHTDRFLRALQWPEELKDVPSICLLHQERLDGSGYPRGVTASDIPVLARILGAADFFDTLNSKYPDFEKSELEFSVIKKMEQEVLSGRLDQKIVATLLELVQSN